MDWIGGIFGRKCPLFDAKLGCRKMGGTISLRNNDCQRQRQLSISFLYDPDAGALYCIAAKQVDDSHGIFRRLHYLFLFWLRNLATTGKQRLASGRVQLLWQHFPGRNRRFSGRYVGKMVDASQLGGCLSVFRRVFTTKAQRRREKHKKSL